MDALQTSPGLMVDLQLLLNDLGIVLLSKNATNNE